VGGGGGESAPAPEKEAAEEGEIEGWPRERKESVAMAAGERRRRGMVGRPIRHA
jgi:hypothetical protein